MRLRPLRCDTSADHPRRASGRKTTTNARVRRLRGFGNLFVIEGMVEFQASEPLSAGRYRQVGKPKLGRTLLRQTILNDHLAPWSARSVASVAVHRLEHRLPRQ